MENNPFAERRARVAAALAARKLDALLVAFSPNLRYLSGFTGSNAALLILPGQSILFTDPRYLSHVEKKFGAAALAHVREMTKYKLKRKLLEAA